MERDDQFYMSLVTIRASMSAVVKVHRLTAATQVEDCLFRIPRQSLESRSKIFRDMFSLPTTEHVEGLSDENPIRLDGITKSEFKRFLEVLFRSVYEETTRPCPPSQIFETWFPVVKLARMWEFDTMDEYAIKNMPYELVPKTSAEKVGLAVHSDIQPWLLPGVNELAQRKEPLGNNDLKLFGPRLALKIAAVRESLAVSSDPYRSHTLPKFTCGSRDASGVDFTPVIKRIFRLPDNDKRGLLPTWRQK